MGDPHLFTFDGEYYDFQSVGEFVAAKSTIDNLELQVRQEDYKEGKRGLVSITTAISFNTGSDVIFLNLSPKQILINSKPLASQDPVTELANDWKLIQNGSDVIVVNDLKKERLEVLFTGHWLSYKLSLGESRKGALNGLLGNFDGKKENDIGVRNGTVFNPGDFRKFYSIFSDEWRIDQSKSLFYYEDGKNTSSYTDKGLPKQEFQMTPELYEFGYTACSSVGIKKEPALSSRIFDVASAYDADLAKSYIDIQNSFDNSMYITDGLFGIWEYIVNITPGCSEMIGTTMNFIFDPSQATILTTPTSAYNFQSGDVIYRSLRRIDDSHYVADSAMSRRIGGSIHWTTAEIILKSKNEMEITYINNDVCNSKQRWRKK